MIPKCQPNYFSKMLNILFQKSLWYNFSCNWVIYHPFIPVNPFVMLSVEQCILQVFFKTTCYFSLVLNYSSTILHCEHNFNFKSNDISGLYYKSMTIVNDDSGVINKLEDSLTVDSRVIIYDHHMFIVQATGLIE